MHFAILTKHLVLVRKAWGQDLLCNVAPEPPNYVTKTNKYQYQQIMIMFPFENGRCSLPNWILARNGGFSRKIGTAPRGMGCKQHIHDKKKQREHYQRLQLVNDAEQRWEPMGTTSKEFLVVDHLSSLSVSSHLWTVRNTQYLVSSWNTCAFPGHQVMCSRKYPKMKTSRQQMYA